MNTNDQTEELKVLTDELAFAVAAATRANRTETAHEMNSARCYGWTEGLHHGWQELTRNLDAYDALEDLRDRRTIGDTSQCEAFALVTTGWAAPLAADGSEPTQAPSKHPDRVRVQLITTWTRHLPGTLVSRVSFADGRDVVWDNGTASGSLAEAIAEVRAALATA